MKTKGHLQKNTHMEGNFKMSFTQTGCEGVDWIRLAQDRIQ